MAQRKKQRSLSCSPICHDAQPITGNASSISSDCDESKQEQQSERQQVNDNTLSTACNTLNGYKEKKFTDLLQIDSPNSRYRSIKKRKWIQNRARAAREAISPHQAVDNQRSSDKDAENLKKYSDISTEPDDSYDSDSDYGSCDAENSKYVQASPIVFHELSSKEKSFAFDDLEITSLSLVSKYDDRNPEKDHSLEKEYPSDEKSAHVEVAMLESFDGISKDSMHLHLSTEHSLLNESSREDKKVFDQLPGNGETEEMPGSILLQEDASLSLTQDTLQRDDTENQSLFEVGKFTCQRETSRTSSSTTRGNLSKKTSSSSIREHYDEYVNTTPSNAYSSHFENIPLPSNHKVAMVSTLSSEEARLNSMLQKLSKASDEKVIRSNWWDDESRIVSLASPTRISVGHGMKTKTDGLDCVMQKLSSFFEDLNLNCNILNACMDDDDRIGHEIDVHDGLHSVVEDDITLDLNSSLLNGSTAASTGYLSCRNSRKR